MATRIGQTRLIDDELGRASSLPSRFYVEPALLEEENEKLFRRTWQPVGHAASLANPGDYVTYELAGEPLVIVRDTSGKLRAFYNVCRHRAGPPAEGCGNRKVFRCGYHGWTYSLEGKLLNAPEMEGVENFWADEFGLRPVRLEEWAGLFFVNLDADAEPLAVALRELPRQAARFPIAQMRPFERRNYFMECNWKVYIDNYLEGYHLPSVHPSLNRELDYSGYKTELFSRHSLQTSSIRGPENESTTQRRYATAKGDEVVDYYWVFPNWMLNCYPDNVSLNIVLPLGPEKTVAIFEWYFLPELLKTSAPADTVRFSDEIQLEDGHICEVVHKNLKSRSYDRGRYSVKQEKGVHHFHRLYSAAMGLE
jgi:choline monooxygenase